MNFTFTGCHDAAGAAPVCRTRRGKAGGRAARSPPLTPLRGMGTLPVALRRRAITGFPEQGGCRGRRTLAHQNGRLNERLAAD